MPTDKWESGIITLFSGANKRIGYKKWYTRFFYDKTIETNWKAPDSALCIVWNLQKLLQV